MVRFMDELLALEPRPTSRAAIEHGMRLQDAAHVGILFLHSGKRDIEPSAGRTLLPHGCAEVLGFVFFV